MASLNEYRQEQLTKLNHLKELGINPYPARTERDITISEITSNFKKLNGKTATVAGRILGVRTHGKLAFADLQDPTAKLQIIFRQSELKSEHHKGLLGFDELKLLTRGDFLEVKGKITKSKTGEISVEAQALRLLSKVLRPLPEELIDKETRLRRRYLDISLNPEVKERFIRRSRFWQATREFLLDEGFLEINVPVLEHTTGGADAKAFETYMDALDEKFYLRISHELPLKRLIGAGYEKVFDIGPRFRNENYTDEHLPEHVAMEFYWAYADWKMGMDLTVRLVRHVAKKTWGTEVFDINGQKLDLSKKWQEIDYANVIKETYGIDVHRAKLSEVKKLLKENNIETGKGDNLARGIDKLWKNIRKDIVGPAFLINVPKFLSPLAKANPDDPKLTERVQLIGAGTELTQSWSELNDPQEQLDRFLEQKELREEGDPEAQMLDIDYVEMLEYGMPPTYGYGHSERLFWMLEGVTAREGVVFPQLRRDIDDVTRSIYGEIFE